MRVTPASPELRDPRSLRERVDAKLGHGVGMSFAEARERLAPAERMEWALGECLFAMLDRRFHLWVQGWCLDGPVDGPAAVAAIAEAARPLDGVVADLLRWTALRGVWARSGERKEALFSVVPEVWLGAWDRVVPFLRLLGARWPEDADPFALPAPPPWTRSTTFVKPRLAFSDAGTVLESTAHALWAAGASEDDLDEFYREAGNDLADAVGRRVDCDPAALTALLNPPDPLARALGIEKIGFPSLHVVPLEREAEILKAAESWNHVVLRPPFRQAARSALRRDPDLLLGWTRDLGPEDVELVTSILQTGHAMLFFGTRDALAGVPPQYGGSPE
ncbi:MAG: hypothetical protein JO332_12310 [Planctomycetaceae bacterium]|nr:hypothetical protein [Planctomycetaceae bacterium]